jgi:hypothetical protein
MKQLFKIDETEKKRILEMHENAVKRNYLNENTPAPQPQGEPAQAARAHDITGNLDGGTAGKTTLPKIKTVEDWSKFSLGSYSGPEGFVKLLNDTGEKLMLVNSNGETVKNKIDVNRLPDGGAAIRNLWSAGSDLMNFLVVGVCSTKNCDGNFTYKDIAAAKISMSQPISDLVKKSPTYQESLKTLNSLTTDLNKTISDSTDTLGRIYYQGFINAMVKIANQKYASI